MTQQSQAAVEEAERDYITAEQALVTAEAAQEMAQRVTTKLKRNSLAQRSSN